MRSMGAECVMITAAALLAGMQQERLSALCRALEEWLKNFGRRRGWAIVIVGIFALSARLLLLPIFPVPVPGVADEFSYLLSGDTFASGRLTNPPNPNWTSFESLHILQQPTYGSMYPPGQGLFLALGEKLGNPWLGVWISVGLLCAAVTWMLQGWVSAAWALAGGLLFAARIGVVSYWINSYWGGAVAAIGGVLVLGSLPRLLQRSSIWDGLILGCGLLILANTRPYEGLIFAACIMVTLFIWRSRSGGVKQALRSIAPALLVLVPAALAMSYYWWRVTGVPWRMPYAENQAAYAVTNPFLWQPLRPVPLYRHREMRQYYTVVELSAYRRAHSVRGWVGECFRRAESLGMFYLWPGILIGVMAAPALWRKQAGRFALIVTGVFFGALTLEIWPMMPHYAAPAAGLAALLLILVLQQVRTWTWSGRHFGLWLSRAVPALCVLALLARVGAQAFAVPMPSYGLLPWITGEPGNTARSELAAKLEAFGGRHLVLVRYSSRHQVGREWVYNQASLDSATVIWAHEMRDCRDESLLDYFYDRTVWLVEADARPPRLHLLRLPRPRQEPSGRQAATITAAACSAKS